MTENENQDTYFKQSSMGKLSKGVLEATLGNISVAEHNERAKYLRQGTLLNLFAIGCGAYLATDSFTFADELHPVLNGVVPVVAGLFSAILGYEKSFNANYHSKQIQKYEQDLEQVMNTYELLSDADAEIFETVIQRLHNLQFDEYALVDAAKHVVYNIDHKNTGTLLGIQSKKAAQTLLKDYTLVA